jgi:hypothetical protein
MLEAAQSIAVFLNDTTLYETVMNRAKEHIRSYIYLSTDGALPITPSWSNYKTQSRMESLWQNDLNFFDGRTQVCETAASKALLRRITDHHS